MRSAQATGQSRKLGGNRRAAPPPWHIAWLGGGGGTQVACPFCSHPPAPRVAATARSSCMWCWRGWGGRTGNSPLSASPYSTTCGCYGEKQLSVVTERQGEEGRLPALPPWPSGMMRGGDSSSPVVSILSPSCSSTSRQRTTRATQLGGVRGEQVGR